MLSAQLGLNPRLNRLEQCDDRSAEGSIAEFYLQLVIAGFVAIVTSFFALNPGRTVHYTESNRPFLQIVMSAAVHFAAGRYHFRARTAVQEFFRPA